MAGVACMICLQGRFIPWRGLFFWTGLDWSWSWSWETFADVFVFGLVVIRLIGSLSIGKDWERLISWDR